ncbi:MAG: 50S ribosomal protein L34 [Phycisphaerales bacterium]|nr:50S ribosomal protein L34 [Phycisphaerales bacterium]MCB9835233.1 50S ribosomal protein L34 [Phycisphaera sp.]
MAMHYPRRVSRLKRIRSQGFRARMKTKGGRKIMNRRRRIGRRIGLKG